MLKSFLKINYFVLIAIIFGLFSFHFMSLAASPAPEKFFYITWETDSSAPVGYKGKKLPSIDSIVKVSVQPIYPGIDTSKWTYRWYLNDELKDYETGPIFRFQIKDYFSGSYVAKAEVEISKENTETLEINIPYTRPKAVIASGSDVIKNGQIMTDNSEVSLSFIPYFFSHSDYDFKSEWYVNDVYFSDGKNISIKKSDYEKGAKVNLIVNKIGDSLNRAANQINLKFF